MDPGTRYAALWAARSRARAAFRSGHSTRLELARSFDGFEDLAGGDALDALGRDYETAHFEAQREAARRLLRGVQARVLETRTLALEVELRERASRARLRIGKQERLLSSWLAI